MAAAKLIIVDVPTSASAVHNCYYAFFWAVRGLLFDKGVTAKKHSGTHQMFGLHLVKSGEIPIRFSDYLFDLFEQRLIADYDGEFDPDQVRKLVGYVDEFLLFVKEKYA